MDVVFSHNECFVKLIRLLSGFSQKKQWHKISNSIEAPLQISGKASKDMVKFDIKSTAFVLALTL